MGVRSAAGGRRPVGVAVAGFGWMGRVHTRAYTRVLHHFPELTLTSELGVSLGDAYQDQPVSTVHVGPGHGRYGAFQPGSAIAMATAAETGTWVKVAAP
jgi:hypothetical protein